MAINAALAQGHSLAGASLYVNLEPCCHTNKRTPPCVPLLLKHQIKKVILSNLDPHPSVNGEGVRQLRSHGVEVILLEEARQEGELLNEIFFHVQHKGRPFIHLKAAISLDGKIALASGHSQWITNELARLDTHGLRHRYDAILVGAQTVRHDRPHLTVRLPGVTINRQPWRLILSKHGENLDPTTPLFSDEWRKRTLLISDTLRLELCPIDQTIQLKNFSLMALDEALLARGITSVMVEGGSEVLSLFLEARHFDRLTLYQAPILLGEGKSFFKAETKEQRSDMNCKIRLGTPQIHVLGDNLKLEYKKASPQHKG
jgi:diaminohydroxyphosphoribosylaminopyrimidine deaminase/5-amino-6-(5-phosphoribosylamino)uracil reductase